MKKLITLFLLLFFVSHAGWAEEVTFDVKTSTTNESETVGKGSSSTFTQNGIDIIVLNTNSSNNPGRFTEGFRIYTGCVFKIVAPTDAVLKKIVLTVGKNGKLTVTPGTYSPDNNTWIADVSQPINVATFTANAQFRFSKAVITYEYSSTATATPTFTPVAGTYNDAQNVAIECATAGSSIFYTTDNSVPSSASTPYTAPIVVDKTTTIKAIATKEGLDNSGVADATYTLQALAPTATPSSSTFETQFDVSLSCATPGSQIYYTINGDEPTTTNSTIYTKAIPITQTTVIKCFATKNEWNNSETAIFNYTKTDPTKDLTTDFVFSELGIPSGNAVGTVVDAFNSIKLETLKAGHSTLSPVYESSDKTMRLYKGNQINISTVSPSFLITGVVINYIAGDGRNLTFNGTPVNVVNNQSIWNNATTGILEIVNPATGGTARILSITVKYRKIVNVTSNLATILDGGVDNVYYEIGLSLQGICADGGYLYAKTEKGHCSHISENTNTPPADPAYE
ncbi:MAG: chitobiase/beta-hexosaminidase C-terminal domain-containing protein, partial [Muribaculaceae bacterium]